MCMVSLYVLAILCCHTIDWDILIRYWCLSQIYYYYSIITIHFPTVYDRSLYYMLVCDGEIRCYYCCLWDIKEQINCRLKLNKLYMQGRQ